MSMDLRKLPVLAKREIPNAELPRNYRAAKKALAECVNVDEIKEIGDKHSAIAHYAKQIKDQSLLHYAQRVYLRAQRRIGELLDELAGGDHSHKARAKAGQKFGIPEHVAGEAGKLAEIPDHNFEQAVESTPPPSKASLISAHRAQRGPYAPQRTEWEKEHWSEPSVRVSIMVGAFEEALVECAFRNNRQWPDAASLALSLNKKDAALIRKRILKLIEWMDEFERHLGNK